VGKILIKNTIASLPEIQFINYGINPQ